MAQKRLPSLPIAPAGLPDGAAPETEVIRWVADNIDNRKVEPENCPSAFAWTLLRQCRDDPEITKWFVEKLWSKLIPSRTQLETKATDDDGKVTIGMIERIQAMHDRAVKSVEKVEEIPDAFSTAKMEDDMK